jgi:hydrogenase expression/formation protein HypD
VGFETTLPAHALALEAASNKGLENLKLLTALRSAPPALSWIAGAESGIDGFICPGHVAVITGVEPFARLAVKYGKPFVIAGFDGEQLLAAIYAAVRMVERVRAGGAAASPRAAADMAVNLYPAAVRREGNVKARGLAARFFEPGAAYWRGLGSLADSGFYIRGAYAAFDGGGRGLDGDSALPAGCRCGDVVMGRATPPECPAFGASCRPDSPVGPCMVSAEGACGIWHQNSRM